MLTLESAYTACLQNYKRSKQFISSQKRSYWLASLMVRFFFAANRVEAPSSRSPQKMAG